MTQPHSEQNCYQKSLSVMKVNVGRVIALMLFLCSFAALLALLTQMVIPIYHLCNGGWHVPTTEQWLNWLTKGAVSIAVLLVGLPLWTGVEKWWFTIGEEPDYPLSAVFDNFRSVRRYGRVLGLRLTLLLLKGTAYAVCLLPAVLVRWGMQEAQKLSGAAGTALSGVLFFVWMCVTVLGIALGFYWNLRYFMVLYLFFRFPSMSYRTLYARSDAMMRFRKTEMVNVYISMGPFYLLLALVLPVLFLLPYINLLLAEKARTFLEQAERIGSWERSADF